MGRLFVLFLSLLPLYFLLEGVKFISKLYIKAQKTHHSVPAICFLVILLAQISEKDLNESDLDNIRQSAHKGIPGGPHNNRGNEDQQYYIDIVDMDLFPGPHSEKTKEVYQKPGDRQKPIKVQEYEEVDLEADVTRSSPDFETDDLDYNNIGNGSDPSDLTISASFNDSFKLEDYEILTARPITPDLPIPKVECVFRFKRDGDSMPQFMRLVKIMEPCSTEDIRLFFNSSGAGFLQPHAYSGALGKNETKGIQCKVSSRPFIMYYLILLFLLCFATPVLIATSLNVFIQAAVVNTTYEVNDQRKDTSKHLS